MTVTPRSAAVSEAGDARLVRALKARDEAAFVEVVDRLTPTMLRLARLYVRSEAVAEEVVQETWVSVLHSLEGFEGRSSFRTWVFAILGNCARKRAVHEGRSIPLADIGGQHASVAEDRFFPSTHPRWAGMWSTLVDAWEDVPDDALLAGEGRERLRRAVAALPARTAAVFVLRDVEGWSGPEVSTLLDITQENQRVLLHRARTRIREALEAYFEVTPR